MVKFLLYAAQAVLWPFLIIAAAICSAGNLIMFIVSWVYCVALTEEQLAIYKKNSNNK